MDASAHRPADPGATVPAKPKPAPAKPKPSPAKPGAKRPAARASTARPKPAVSGASASATSARPAAKAPATPAAAKQSAAKPRPTAKSTAAKSTAAKSTAAKSTAAKSTAAKGTAVKGATAKQKTTSTTAPKAATAKRTTAASAGADGPETVGVTAADATDTTDATLETATSSPINATAAHDAVHDAAHDSAAQSNAAATPPAGDTTSATLSDAPAALEAETGEAETAPTSEPEPETVPAPESEPEPTPAVDAERPAALTLRGVTKAFGDTKAVAGVDLEVPAGSFYGIVGPNGAGKTTTLSIIAGLLRPDSGTVLVRGIDALAEPEQAKRLMGILPDRLRTFDRLTGRQLLYYFRVLRGMKPAVVESRTEDLARAFDLSDSLHRMVADFSVGMKKKLLLAGAMIHSPRLLVLDEPFESVDPTSSAVILEILATYVAHGGTVVLSSHGMELVERVCSRVAVIVSGRVLAEGTLDEVRGELTLEERFVELSGGLSDVEGLEWLHTFSD